MSVSQSAHKVWRNPIGRLLSLFVGMGLLAGVLTLYPQSRTVVKWSVPVCLILWGGTRFYLYRVEDTLSSAAGCLLILGGFSYALYLFTPMSELNGALAQFVPVAGIFAELFAAHYRNQE